MVSPQCGVDGCFRTIDACQPISLPDDDPQFNGQKSCIPYIRSQAIADVTCSIGRELYTVSQHRGRARVGGYFATLHSAHDAGSTATDSLNSIVGVVNETVAVEPASWACASRRLPDDSRTPTMLVHMTFSVLLFHVHFTAMTGT